MSDIFIIRSYRSNNDGCFYFSFYKMKGDKIEYLFRYDQANHGAYGLSVKLLEEKTGLKNGDYSLLEMDFDL